MITRYGVLILVAHLTVCLSTSAQDHLEPERGILNQPEWNWNYAKRLREVLLKDAADYHVARMVCLPTFEPEWVVTVVRRDGEDSDAPHSYYVNYAGADVNLFRPEPSQRLTVKKLRVPLERKTAERLNKTWRLMLHRTRYPNEPRLGNDGVTYHFSRFLPMFDQGKPDPLAGSEQGRIWVPITDSPCGELAAIGERLKDYAQADPGQRDKLSSEIVTMADTLAQKA